MIVLAAFVFGTVQLIVPAGAGAGQGPLPVWKPTTSNWLRVQVIGQQWAFTYRYPQFGGFETTQLLLPSNRTIEFNVTSLDVIHSFWAYQLGVKADANPNVNNVAYTDTKSELGSFTVRCSELCGIWHGAMFNYGHIVTPAAFNAWATRDRECPAEERHAGRAAAVLAHLRPDGDPADGQGPGQERDHRCRRLLLPAVRPGDAMIAARSQPTAATVSMKR